MALGDVNGDGIADIITGAGPGGGPHVRVFSGVDRHELRSFFAYAPAFWAACSVAAGDVNGDGHADIITGAGPGGGPHVQVFSGEDAATSSWRSFFAYDPDFTGGVHRRGRRRQRRRPGRHHHRRRARRRPARAGVQRRRPDRCLRQLLRLRARRFPGGVNVAAGDVNGDGRADIITGAGPGGGPHVEVFSGADWTALASFFAYDAGVLRAGVNVAARR